MAYAPYCRATLLIPFNDVPHLFVVLNDPCKDGLCLLVMLTSVKENKPHDKSCILKKGDHEFIVKPSYVLYRLAGTTRAKHIEYMVAKKFYVPKSDVTQEIFDLIITGLFISEETRPSILKYDKENGLKRA